MLHFLSDKGALLLATLCVLLLLVSGGALYKTPTVPDLPEDDTTLSARDWHAMLWLRLGEISYRLTCLALMLAGIFSIFFFLCMYLLSH